MSYDSGENHNFEFTDLSAFRALLVLCMFPVAKHSRMHVSLLDEGQFNFKYFFPNSLALQKNVRDFNSVKLLHFQWFHLENISVLCPNPKI